MREKSMIRSELEMPDRLITDTDTLRPNYAKYTAEPFERGFGTTLGNSLRRVLLSSIKGAAITAVQIEQVKHEYATIPGVVEDVVQIILNLKEIRLSIATDDPIQLTLKADGSGEITAADIRSNAFVEIINPDQHVATLYECEGLDIEIHAQTGRGYSLAEDHRETGHEIGLIPVDAKFSPVEKVNFWVEETRVGDMTNFDKLNLEVWTDATITAKEAVTRAANILLQQLEILQNSMKATLNRNLRLMRQNSGAIDTSPSPSLNLNSRSAPAIASKRQISKLYENSSQKRKRICWNIRTLGEHR